MELGGGLLNEGELTLVSCIPRDNSAIGGNGAVNKTIFARGIVDGVPGIYAADASGNGAQALVNGDSGINAIGSITTPESTLLCSPAPSGLAAWWKFENDALDLIGSNHLTFEEGATFGTGRVRQALSLKNAGYARAADSPAASPGSLHYRRLGELRRRAHECDLTDASFQRLRGA